MSLPLLQIGLGPVPIHSKKLSNGVSSVAGKPQRNATNAKDRMKTGAMLIVGYPNASVRTALACRIQSHHDKCSIPKRFLPPKTFPKGSSSAHRDAPGLLQTKTFPKGSSSAHVDAPAVDIGVTTMPKRTSSYAPWLASRLKDPGVAEEYLKASRDSPEEFLKALRKVAEAHQVSKVAEAAGKQRESVYRMLSEEGNPRLDSLWSMLQVMGLRLDVEAIAKEK
jgi:probable addiction module antidote protein